MYISNINETELIHTARQGDLDAFNSLILKHQHLLFRIATRIMPDEMQAADMVQDSCLLAFQKLKSFRDGSFRNWFARILVNRCYDELRRQRRRAVFSLDQEDEKAEKGLTASWLADHSLNPETQFDTREVETIVQRCLAKLSPKHRAVLVLIDMEDFSYLEASSMLKIPIGTVKSSLARARLHFRGLMLAMNDQAIPRRCINAVCSIT